MLNSTRFINFIAVSLGLSATAIISVSAERACAQAAPTALLRQVVEDLAATATAKGGGMPRVARMPNWTISLAESSLAHPRAPRTIVAFRTDALPGGGVEHTSTSLSLDRVGGQLVVTIGGTAVRETPTKELVAADQILAQIGEALGRLPPGVIGYTLARRSFLGHWIYKFVLGADVQSAQVIEKLLLVGLVAAKADRDL